MPFYVRDLSIFGMWYPWGGLEPIPQIPRNECIANHHTVHLKYMQFLFVNYSSINWGAKKHN